MALGQVLQKFGERLAAVERVRDELRIGTRKLEKHMCAYRENCGTDFWRY